MSDEIYDSSSYKQFESCYFKIDSSNIFIACICIKNISTFLF